MQTKEGRKIEWETRHVRLKGSQREKNRVQCTQVKERERKKKKKKREEKNVSGAQRRKTGTNETKRRNFSATAREYTSFADSFMIFLAIMIRRSRSNTCKLAIASKNEKIFEQFFSSHE